MPGDAGSYNSTFTSAHASICGLPGYPDGRNVELRTDGSMDFKPGCSTEDEEDLLEQFKADKENYVTLWHLEEEPCIIQRPFADLFLLAKVVPMAGKIVKLHLYRRSSPEQNPVLIDQSPEQAVETSAEDAANASGNQEGPSTEAEAHDAMARALSKESERKQDQPDPHDDLASEDDASSNTSESRSEEADTSWHSRPAESSNIWPDDNPSDFTLPVRTVGGPARTLGASNALERPGSPQPVRPEPWLALPEAIRKKYERELREWKHRKSMKENRRIVKERMDAQRDGGGGAQAQDMAQTNIEMETSTAQTRGVERLDGDEPDASTGGVEGESREASEEDEFLTVPGRPMLVFE